MLPTIKNQSDAIPLIHLKIGQQAKILRIEKQNNSFDHLSDLGIIPGSEVKKISEAPFGGPIQISIQNSRLAIGKGLAENIWVVPY